MPLVVLKDGLAKTVRDYLINFIKRACSILYLATSPKINYFFNCNALIDFSNKCPNFCHKLIYRKVAQYENVISWKKLKALPVLRTSSILTLIYFYQWSYLNFHLRSYLL